MSIQYSGGAHVSTFSPSVKQDIINDVETALLAAGWTTISGHGTTNLLMQSAATPQSLQINVRLKDNGGTCVTFSLENTAGTVVGANSTTAGGGFLSPAGSPTYQVVASKYQAFIYATPYTGLKQSYVAFGVPYVPSWITGLTALAWMHGNAQNDTDSTNRQTFRNSFRVAAGSPGSQQVIINGSTWTDNSGNQNNGNICLAALALNPQNSGSGAAYVVTSWSNGSALLVDAIIAWGTASSSATGMYRGQLWDACISTSPYAADSTANFDSHTWTVVTAQSTDWTGLGTLLLATS